jgi:aryl-alcohol dehydrogenase-like predicted oxidoreductase
MSVPTIGAPNEVVDQLDASLRALRTDHVDIYQMHSGSDEVYGRDDLWEALGRQVSNGKVRHLGISLGGGDDLGQVQRAAELGVSVVQVTYNRLTRAPEHDVFGICVDHGLGVLTREPLANGYLSGRYRPGARVTSADDWRSAQDPAQVETKLLKVEQIRRTEVPDDVDMPAWALAWCLRHPAVTAAVAGCKSTEHVEANARVADLDLVPADHPLAVAAP